MEKYKFNAQQKSGEKHSLTSPAEELKKIPKTKKSKIIYLTTESTDSKRPREFDEADRRVPSSSECSWSLKEIKKRK